MKIRPILLQERQSYAENTPVVTDDILDCSLGENPYGFPPSAARAVAAFDVKRLAHYPHSHAATEGIIKYWSEYAALKPENIILTDGSIGGLYLVNALFAVPGAKVVGFVPTFTDMMVNCRLMGMTYEGVPMDAARDFAADTEALEAAIDENTSLVYVDNPNNPTGQIIPVPQLERLARKAAACGACLLVDEAYGGFVPRGESMTAVFSKYDNVIVARTFSKGFGLAGLRAGYLIAPAQAAACMGRLGNPYMMNELTREAVAAAMEEPEWPISRSDDFVRAKEELKKRTGHALTLLRTDPRVPICTLRHKDPGADLQRLLYEAGVLTVSGAEFAGLGASAVRLRVPEAARHQKLFDAVEHVDRA